MCGIDKIDDKILRFNNNMFIRQYYYIQKQPSTVGRMCALIIPLEVVVLDALAGLIKTINGVVSTIFNGVGSIVSTTCRKNFVPSVKKVQNGLIICVSALPAAVCLFFGLLISPHNVATNYVKHNDWDVFHKNNQKAFAAALARQEEKKEECELP